MSKFWVHVFKGLYYQDTLMDYVYIEHKYIQVLDPQDLSLGAIYSYFIFFFLLFFFFSEVMLVGVIYELCLLALVL